MNDKLERMIIMQAGAQRETFGYHFTDMTRDELIAYIRIQQQAAVQELGEVLNEVDWKPWTTAPRQLRRPEFMNELVDVLHFWLNLALAVSGKSEATELADEIFTRFAMKNRINAQRQADGYDGVSTKCGGCQRALDDLGVECRRVGDQGFCAKLNADVNYVEDIAVVAVWNDRVEEKLAPIEPEICLECKQGLTWHGCQAPTTERWGFCMANVNTPKNIPPIKLPTT